MNSKLENSVEIFLRKTFESNPSYNNLTKAALRADYMKENNVTEFSKKDKKMFSETVNKIIVEFADAIKASKKHADLNEKPQTELYKDAPIANGCSTNGRSSSSDEKMNCDSDADSDSDALVIDESAPTVSKSEKKDVEKEECQSLDPIPNSTNEEVDEHPSEEISDSEICEEIKNVTEKSKEPQIKGQALNSSFSDAEIESEKEDVEKEECLSIETLSSSENEEIDEHPSKEISSSDSKISEKIINVTEKNKKSSQMKRQALDSSLSNAEIESEKEDVEKEECLSLDPIPSSENEEVDEHPSKEVSSSDSEVSEKIRSVTRKNKKSSRVKRQELNSSLSDAGIESKKKDVEKEERLSLDPIPSSENEEVDEYPSKGVSSSDSEISEKIKNVTVKSKKPSRMKRPTLNSSLSVAEIDSGVNSSDENHRSDAKEIVISNSTSKKRKRPTREPKSKLPTKRIKLAKKPVDDTSEEDDDDGSNDDVNDEISKKKQNSQASKLANTKSEKKVVEKKEHLSIETLPSSENEEIDEHPSKEISSSDSEDSEQIINITKKSKKTPRVKRQALNSSLSDAEINESSSDVNASVENHPSDEKENVISKSSSKKRKKTTCEPKGKLPTKRIKLAKKAVDDTSEEDDDGSNDDVNNEIPKKKQKSQAPKLAKTDLKSHNGKQVRKKQVNKVPSSDEDEDEESAGVKKTKSAAKGNKDSPTTNAKIERLKKYVRTAGLRIPSYDKVFESCKSLKAKANKLLEILENEGMKGRPTLEKCKKLKKKIEQKKEMESLDVTLIINTGKGRPKRNVRSLYVNTRPVEDEDSNHSAEKIYSRLKALADSDDSS